MIVISCLKLSRADREISAANLCEPKPFLLLVCIVREWYCNNIVIIFGTVHIVDSADQLLDAMLFILMRCELAYPMALV